MSGLSKIAKSNVQEPRLSALQNSVMFRLSTQKIKASVNSYDYHDTILRQDLKNCMKLVKEIFLILITLPQNKTRMGSGNIKRIQDLKQSQSTTYQG